MATYSRRGQDQQIEITEIQEKDNPDGTKRVTFRTSDGNLDAMYHPVQDADAGLVLLSGAGGGFIGPASVYADLAREVAESGIASIRASYRFPNDLTRSVVDAMIAIQYLHEEGIDSVGVVGWSFGGAVAISAAAVHENVKAVATVATQSYGTEGAAHLDGKPILLLHGAGDRTLPTSCSDQVYRIAHEPKELKIYEEANHGLDEVRDQMLRKLKEFFLSALEA